MPPPPQHLPTTSAAFFAEAANTELSIGMTRSVRQFPLSAERAVTKQFQTTMVFSGLIDEVRVYNRALSQVEIQTDMNTPLGVPAGMFISSIAPASGAVGTAVTITGSGFTGATLVRFNATAQPAFTVVRDTTITTTVPVGATSGPVQVVTAGGTATSASAFTVTVPMFAQLCALDERSFLHRPFLENLKAARGKTTNEAMPG